MTIFRFRKSAALIAMLLEPSCGKSQVSRGLPDTTIGKIMRLGEIGRINAELTRHLTAV